MPRLRSLDCKDEIAGFPLRVIIRWCWGWWGSFQIVQPKFYCNVPLVYISTMWFPNPHTTGSLPEAALFSRLLIKMSVRGYAKSGLCLPSGVTA